MIERLRPRHWAVRWRLAVGSAALTLAILIAFAVAVGRLVSDRLEEDFRDELRSTANALALEVQVANAPGVNRPVIRSPRLEEVAMADHAEIRIVSGTGSVLAQTPNATNLGRPSPKLRRAGDLRVASEPIATDAFGAPDAFVQYAEPHENVEATIQRLWLFLALGVLGGTALATLAGLAVANRAMRPVASLTGAAREIAETRDPSRRVPQPEADDEVAELARTLDQMLQSLDAARTDTDRAMQRQREFVADASHELRTPLTSVLANLELLQAAVREEEGSESVETVDSAMRSSQRMRRLVDDLLILARADAGRAGPRTSCDLAAIVRDAVSEAEAAGGRRIDLRVGGPVRVTGSADELHRMTLNLLRNATQHTPHGAAVTATVARRDGHAVLEVVDDGEGIPAELTDSIFERFVRGGGDTGGGTGLGLAIVRAVAETHGGRVEVSNRPGGGARFAVELPLESDSPALARV